MTSHQRSIGKDQARPGAGPASGTAGALPARGAVELQEDALEQVAGGARLKGQLLSSTGEDNPRKGNVDYSWKVEAGE